MFHFKAAKLLKRTELVTKVLYNCCGYGWSLNLENVVDQRVHLYNYIRAQFAQTKKTLFIYLFV